MKASELDPLPEAIAKMSDPYSPWDHIKRIEALVRRSNEMLETLKDLELRDRGSGED